jgi:DNA-binding PadR family transcriptional regulator
MLMAHGVTTGLLADLVRDGLATTRRESVKMGGRLAEVTRVNITEAGRKAIEG